MSWKYEKLGDYCDITSSKRIFYSEYVDSGIPFYRSKEIIEKFNHQSISEPLFISETKYYDLKEKFGIPQENDILLTSVGTIGIPYIVNKQDKFYFKDGNLTWFRNFNDKLLSKYLFFWLNSKNAKGLLNNTVIGSSQKALTISALKKIKIPIPPIETQEKIANILSNYDDLIENNQKQIKLLEEAAQRLYKKWFVDFHFPNYETTPFVNGLPQGWKKTLLGKLKYKLESGSRPKGGIDASLSNGVVSLGAESITDLGQYNYKSEKYIPFTFYENMKKGIISNKDILIYKDGAYIGKTTLFQDEYPFKIMTVNEHVFLLHMDNEDLQYYMFFTLYQNLYFYKIQNLNTNSAQPGINTNSLSTLDIIIPNDTLINQFNKRIEPIMKEIFNKAKQINKLTEARDRLLTKLMNEEIEV